MKKFIITLTFGVFCATALLSQAFAAPAGANSQRATGGGALTNLVSSNASSQANSIAAQDLGIRLAAASSSNTRATGNRATRASSNRATTNRANQRATSTRKANTRANQRATAQSKSKAQERREAQNREFGLMASELDNMSHNVFHADANAIKGARDTESALRYLPFVTIINTAGFGSQFDLRGQGRLSANGVKMYINGVAVNPADAYFAPMPMNTVLPSLTHDIEVYPGGGAVLYGSGAKGGTINIITSKREAPFFLAGAGYLNTMGAKGSSYNAFAQAAENLGIHTKVNAGLGFQALGGPREDDSLMQGQAVLGGWYDIGWGQSVSADVDVYYGKTKTSPNNALVDAQTMVDIVRNTPLDRVQGGDPTERTRHYNLANLEDVDTKNIGNEKGLGEIETTQIRAVGKLGWNSQLTERLKLGVDAFATYNSIKYDKYTMSLPYFVLGSLPPSDPSQGGYIWFHPRPTNQSNTGTAGVYMWNDISAADPSLVGDGGRTDMHFLDQSGTKIDDTKFGGDAKVNWQHDGGELIFGVNFVYETNKRDSKTHLRRAIIDDSETLSGNGIQRKTITADVDSKVDTNILTTSVYLMDNYRLNNYFSVMGGMRYELKNYNVKANDEFVAKTLTFVAGNNGNMVNFGNWTESAVEDPNGAQKEFKKSFDNFTFELAPVFKYSNSGSIYARGELGYNAPPAWAMLQRIGAMQGDRGGYSVYNYGVTGIDFEYLQTNLESETYYTIELGWKELFGTRRVPLLITNLDINALLFSANLFYTASQNEFFFEGDTWSGMHYANYDQSRRMGAEIALEQYVFGGALGFNESFTYIQAQKKGKPARTYSNADAIVTDDWDTIPYTYNYKATFGANVNITTFLEVVDVSVSVWLQNSLYGNQSIPVVKIDAASSGRNLVYEGLRKLDPYLISDLGVSVGLNKNMGVITVGVKNVFDTFYYDYYNADRSAVVTENRFVTGRGRTVFVEGTFRY